ncbi:MAG: class I SAM-dependent methyltransferase [Acidobacteriales bacterium]|nr:class I SAM-dependent methyltransferase [Terriglobales bacterium]
MERKMDYREQERFLERYATVWMVAAGALVVGASLAMRKVTWESVTFLAAVVAVAGTLSYLPKYLHIHHEPDRRYRWAVRARWIMVATSVVFAVAVAGRDRIVLEVVLGSGVWLALVNLFLKTVCKREALLGYRWMAPFYFFGDLLMILLLATVMKEKWFLIAALLVIAVEFAIVLNDGLGIWFPILLMAISATILRQAVLPEAYGFGSGYLVVMAAGVAASASALTLMAQHQARRNLKKTALDLSAFTGMPEAEAETRLVSSHALIIESWKKAALDEKDKAALARWYSENALNYMFSLARFHLTYKHITFTLDMLRLSRGRCLDYGAGKGELALELARRGLDVTYYDVPGKSREYAEWEAARRKANLRFLSSKEELQTEVAARGKFDTILTLDVLEHLPDLRGELEFLLSLLAPKGRLLMTVPEGATESQPMHLSHDLSTLGMLEERGLRSLKTPWMRLMGSEILRKKHCVVVEMDRDIG